jgi:hypothetical protein|nr:hypothetical protein [Kofleriaceae bacterium]
MRTLSIITLLALAGCGDSPSCDDAFTKFYAAGCTIHDATGSAVALATEIAECKTTLAQLGSDATCESDDESYLSCLDGVEASSGTSTSATCNSCFQEQAMLASCQVSSPSS